jgi:hypothetical protein
MKQPPSVESPRVRISLAKVGLAALLAAASVPAARADDYSWNNASGGNWNLGTNWNPPGPPAAADNALIDLAGTYPVNLTDNRAITNLTINNATATLIHTTGTFTVGGTIALSAGSYSLDGGTISGGSITSSGGLLKLGNSNNNRINNVALGLNVLDFTTAGARVRLQGSTTLAAGTTINIALNQTFFGFEQTATVNNLTVNLSNNAALSVEGNNTLTLGPNVTITIGTGGG